MSIDLSRLGWIDDPEAVAASCERMGTQAYLATARPSIAGAWKRQNRFGFTGTFLWHGEEELIGRQPSFHQTGPTCVSMGTIRAIQDSYYTALVWRSEIASAKQLCTEMTYGGSRNEVGRGRLGKDGGSIGAWGAEWVHDYGLVPRGVYGKYDLRKLRDDLAVDWGRPGVGVPAELEALGKSHLVGSCHRCMTVEEIADAVASGYAVAYCSNLIWSDTRNAKGICEVESSGGHCEEICGVCEVGGRLVFVRQNSWGNYLRGPDVLTYDGGTVQLREGSYGAWGDDVARGLRNGEAWAYGDVQPWRPESVEEMA